MFQKYNRKAVPAEMRPFVPGEELDPKISVGPEDKANGSPKEGDFIGRDPVNHNDQWLVNAAYFAEKFDPTPIGPAD